MNTKTIGITGVVVAVIALGAYFAMRKPAHTPATNQTGSLKTLLSSGSPQRCTVTNVAGNANSNGTVLVAGGKMRGDFTSEVNGQTTASHMIIMDNTSYIWTDAVSQGFKISLDETTKGSTETQRDNQSVDITQNVNYSCEPWSPDDNSFALPSGIQFKSMAEMMPAVPANNVPFSGSNNLKAVQCKQCDTLPSEQKTQCRAALGCNYQQ